jgi:hypothetical protein
MAGRAQGGAQQAQGPDHVLALQLRRQVVIRAQLNNWRHLLLLLWLWLEAEGPHHVFALQLSRQAVAWLQLDHRQLVLLLGLGLDSSSRRAGGCAVLRGCIKGVVNGRTLGLAAICG